MNQNKKQEDIVIILDLNSLGWLNLKKIQSKQQDSPNNQFDIDDMVEILVYQLNLFYLQNNEQQAYLLIFDEIKTIQIFPKTEEDYLEIQHTIFQRVFEYLQSKTPIQTMNSKFISAFYRAICILNRLQQTKKSSKRILTILISDVEEKECFNHMNCIQAARSLNIISDCLVLTRKVQNYLTQISSKTQGLYLPSPPIITKSIIEYFLSAFAINGVMRKYFKLPYPNVASYESVCFCHKKKIETGWICSSCLGIFCKEQNDLKNFSCLFCGVRFDNFLNKELIYEQII